MNIRVPTPLPPGCPWSGWALPDLKHCEENVCGWITAPADTWSNLAYIAVGLWLWSRSKREAPGPLRWFGPAAVLAGATSFIFHASYTFFFQFFDYVGMFSFICLMAALNLRRLGLLADSRIGVFYAESISLSCALLLGLRGLGLNIQPLFVLQVLAVAASEIWLAPPGVHGGAVPPPLSNGYGLARASPAPSYADAWRTLGLFGAAVAFWLLDFSRLACDPANHWLQGHAAWHVFSAPAFATALAFHRQFFPPAAA